MAAMMKPKKPKRVPARSCLGPVADLEQHLPAEWWRKLFNALYVKTDGDVVENNENTRREVDFIVAASAIQPHSAILDLCCGQGRHCLELALRGAGEQAHLAGLLFLRRRLRGCLYRQAEDSRREQKGLHWTFTGSGTNAGVCLPSRISSAVRISSAAALDGSHFQPALVGRPMPASPPPLT